MKLLLIYPKWIKLKNQPEFNLPPHGPVVFAAALPSSVEVVFCDENVEDIDFSPSVDLVAISAMLTCQMPRAWEIADRFRESGYTVIMGGIGVNLHTEECLLHADSVFLGEAEGYINGVIADFEAGKLKKLYQKTGYPDTALIKPARRDILKRDLYNFRGVPMVDLVHASRGCRFNCFPCCTPYLGGRKFRPRPVDMFVEELKTIENNRLFVVDNSLAQNDDWEKKLFKAMIPLKKKWVCHPIKDDDEILDLAAEAGCWYVYQAIFDTSDYIRNRVKRYKDRGIGVEGTIILGVDDHDEDYIKRLIDFLLEIDLDLAEFTILTPFPHTPIREQMQKEGRILHNDWKRYTAGEVVYKPAKMSPDALQNMYEYAWDTFYGKCGKELKMAKLYLDVMKKEQADGIDISLNLRNRRAWGRGGKRQR